MRSHAWCCLLLLVVADIDLRHDSTSRSRGGRLAMAGWSRLYCLDVRSGRIRALPEERAGCVSLRGWDAEGRRADCFRSG
ncbi:hypothetical protein BJY59DRAFT_119763 [Rhodotorula toruloides]